MKIFFLKKGSQTINMLFISFYSVLKIFLKVKKKTEKKRKRNNQPKSLTVKLNKKELNTKW